MEEGPSPALDFALEYISLNSWIEDRNTLLTLRLVGRAWRMFEKFSDKITAVTLHTLADVQLAAAYLPSTPCQRLPWRSVEESCVFQNVTTLNVPEDLSWELSRCIATRVLLTSIPQVHVQILSFSVESITAVSKVFKLARMGCFQQLSWYIDPSILVENAADLSGLRKLVLCTSSVIEFQSLANLSQLRSLRYLGLPRNMIEDCMPNRSRMDFCLRSCAALTHLARLDFLERTRGYQEPSSLVNYFAPGAVQDFESLLSLEGTCKLDWPYLHTEACDGHVVPKLFQCVVTLDTIQRLCDPNITKVLQYGSSSECLSIKLSSSLVDGFYMDLVIGTPPQKKVFNISFDGSECRNQEAMEVAPVLAPVFVSRQGVRMAVSQFTVKRCKCNEEEVIALVRRVFVLFPQLRCLELDLGQRVAPVARAIAALMQFFTSSSNSGNGTSSAVSDINGSSGEINGTRGDASGINSSRREINGSSGEINGSSGGASGIDSCSRGDINGTRGGASGINGTSGEFNDTSRGASGINGSSSDDIDGTSGGASGINGTSGGASGINGGSSEINNTSSKTNGTSSKINGTSGGDSSINGSSCVDINRSGEGGSSVCTVRIGITHSNPSVSPPHLSLSLRELCVDVHSLELLSLSQMKHLTRLKVTQWNSEDTAAVVALLSCHAPLTELSIRGGYEPPPQELMFAVPAAFPGLQTLEMDLGSADVSPLSSLRHLQVLKVTLLYSGTEVLTGVSALTTLVSLDIECANCCFEGLDHLASLTQLRHLKYTMRYGQPSFMFPPELGPSFRLHWDEQKYQLCERMPHTRIDMKVNNDGKQLIP